MQISEKEFKASAKRLVKALDIELKHQSSLQVLSQSLFGVSFEQAKATLFKDEQARDDISFYAIDTGSSLILCNSKGEYCDRGDYINKNEFGDIISHFEHHAWSFNESLPVVIDMPEYLQGIFEELDCDDELIPICVILGIIECDKPNLLQELEKGSVFMVDSRHCLYGVSDDWSTNIADEGMTGLIWCVETCDEMGQGYEYFFTLEDFMKAKKAGDVWFIDYPVGNGESFKVEIQIFGKRG